MSRDGGQKKRKGESTELKRGQRKGKGWEAFLASAREAHANLYADIIRLHR